MGKSCPKCLRIATEKLSMAENFSDRLKAARARRGWVQADLARELDVSPGSVGNWESGQNTPGHRTIVRLSEILGTTVGWLMTGEISGTTGGNDENPAWVSDLEQRLRGQPEPARRRLLAAFHSILDAVEPLQLGVSIPRGSPAADLPPVASDVLRSEPHRNHPGAPATEGPGSGARPRRPELSAAEMEEMAAEAEQAAGLAPAGGSPTSANTPWPNASGSRPSGPVPPGSSRGTGAPGTAPGGSAASSEVRRRPHAPAPPNPDPSRATRRS